MSPCIESFPCFKEIDEEEEEKKRQSKALDIRIKYDRRKLRKEKRLLLLGTGEAGKSTFLKTLQIGYGDGISDDEKRKKIKLVHQNIVLGMVILVRYMDEKNIAYENEINKGRASTIGKMDPDEVEKLHKDQFTFIKGLWDDAKIKEIFKKRAEYEIQITDSAEYFFNNLDRISEPDFLPTDQDILYIRQPTSGITFTEFNMKGFIFKVIDVGGQRGERRKWIKVFDDITAVIFLTAISEYDQLLDDITTNELHSAIERKKRIDESLDIFEAVLDNKFFQNSFFVLFLNKHDLFKKKIMEKDLKDHFPNYEGPEKDLEAGGNFMKQEFLNRNRNNLDMFTHFTCAVNTENTKKIFEIVRAKLMSVPI